MVVVKAERNASPDVWRPCGGSFIVSSPASAIEASDEEAAIRAVIARVREGFVKLDAAQVASAYSADAEWTNAFGVTKRSRGDLEQFLKRLFVRPEFRGGAESPSVVLSLRLLRPTLPWCIVNLAESPRSMATGAAC